MTLDAASAAARTSALIVAESERGVLVVSGSERASWLNGVVTCDVAAVGKGQAAFGLVLSKVGKIQSDFYVFSRDPTLCLAVSPGTEATTRAELERMLVMEDAELESASSELACVALHGPRAVSIASSVASQDGVSVAELDRTGFGGAVLLAPRASIGAFVATLVAAGGFVASAEQWERLRVERRLGEFGRDYGPTDNPHEAALDRVAVSWTKGCYLGQEVVFMQDARGKLKRRLVQLELEGPLSSGDAEVVDSAGERVGEVTSSTISAVLGASLALARVKAPHHEPGVRLRVSGVPAVVRAGSV